MDSLAPLNGKVAGVIGLGYVGLPLVVELARSGYQVIGVDINAETIARLNRGESHIGDVPSEDVARLVQERRFSATTVVRRLAECDLVSICVPTPLNKIKDPDLSYVVAATEAVKSTLRRGQLIILESTTYPGTTREVVLPALATTGLEVGNDFFLCFSPERVDPGNAKWKTRNTPKVIGGITEACLAAGVAAYGAVFDTLVPVKSAEAAELVKVYENTFRMVNIALANELAQACDKLGIDVWDVIDAAATKPFGFMRFVPGPGLGGHCIPLDPHYLQWKMRALAFRTRLIEVASEVNADMPMFVVKKMIEALNARGKAVHGASVLVLGVAYKKNIGDLRESPAIDIISQLQRMGATISYHDPHCPVIEDDGHTPIKGLPLRSEPLTPAVLSAADAVMIVTDHDAIDFALVGAHSSLLVDTRGAMRGMPPSGTVVGLS